MKSLRQKNNKVRILFLGSGRFACEPFDALQLFCADNDEFAIVGMITQPDRPAGRGKQLTACSFCEHSRQNPHCSNIPLFQPQHLAEQAKEILDQTRPDLIIVIDYGQIVPQSMLDYPKYQCLNIHHSLLPQLRGATPVPNAILLGLEQTGTTIQIMHRDLDKGDILVQERCSITPTDTALSLGKKLSQIAARLLVQTLPQWIAGQIIPIPQDETLASYCKQSDLDKSNARIIWDQPAPLIDRLIRAFYPNPVAWYTFRGLRVRLLGSRLPENYVSQKQNNPGVVVVQNNRLFVQTKTGLLEILELQPEGKKPMSAKDFLNGYRPKVGEMFE